MDFHILATDSGWDSESFQAGYINALSERVKDELVSYPEPVKLDELIKLSIHIDSRIRGKMERKVSLECQCFLLFTDSVPTCDD